MDENGARSSRQRVLEYLLDQSEPVTRPDVASACDVSRPTAFTAIERLEAAGLVSNAGQLSGKVGRSATLYEVPGSVGVLAGIDVGGSNLRVAVADVRGRLLAEHREATVRAGGRAIVEQAIALVRSALESAKASPEALAGVGVSVPGVVGADGDTVYYASNIDQFDAFDFRTPFRSAFGAPVDMDNNVNLAAIGERWRGMARDLDTFAVVAVGAGVGAGIVHAGALLRGAHGAAGEVAFLPPEGSLRKLDARAHDAAGGLSLLHEAQDRPGWADAPPASVEELFRRAEKQEEPADTLVEEECQRIALVIASLCAVVDPEVVILTGGVGANDSLIARAEQLAAEMTIFPPALRASELGERASLTGAIHLASQRARRELVRVAADC